MNKKGQIAAWEEKAANLQRDRARRRGRWLRWLKLTSHAELVISLHPFFSHLRLLFNLLTIFLHSVVWTTRLFSHTHKHRSAPCQQPPSIIIYCSNFHRDADQLLTSILRGFLLKLGVTRCGTQHSSSKIFKGGPLTLKLHKHMKTIVIPVGVSKESFKQHSSV